MDTNNRAYLREVDVNRPGVHRIDFESPLCQQYHIAALPSFRIYDPNGKMVAEGTGQNQQVITLLKKFFDPASK